MLHTRKQQAMQNVFQEIPNNLQKRFKRPVNDVMTHDQFTRHIGRTLLGIYDCGRWNLTERAILPS